MKLPRLPDIGGGCGGCSRRELLKLVGAAATGVAIGCTSSTSGGSSLPHATASMCGTTLCIDLSLAANADLTMADGAMLADAPSDTIMVIRSSDTAVIALSAICTHAGCSLDFIPGSNLIDCPCHGSQFSETGAVVRGPARLALRVYSASLANNLITIVL